MREVIKIEINGSPVVIGWSAMYFPTNNREKEKGHVFKSLRLIPKDLSQEGDTFFFESKKRFKNDEWVDDWFLIPEFGFIATESPLIDLYMNCGMDSSTTYDQFVEAVFRHHYWEG